MFMELTTESERKMIKNNKNINENLKKKNTFNMM